MAKIATDVGPKYPQVVVLVGATGDLAKRKLIPGLYHLYTSGFIPDCRSMFPKDSGVGLHGPDHLTFDLSDTSRTSLSFYGKRPGPGMKLDKHSLQFSMDETKHIGDVLEAYERLILDAMRGDHTLFTTSDGIERLWEVSAPLIETPPPVMRYSQGSWGPNAIHQLIAPRAWRLPFERAWRD